MCDTVGHAGLTESMFCVCFTKAGAVCIECPSTSSLKVRYVGGETTGLPIKSHLRSLTIVRAIHKSPLQG